MWYIKKVFNICHQNSSYIGCTQWRLRKINYGIFYCLVHFWALYNGRSTEHERKKSLMKYISPLKSSTIEPSSNMLLTRHILCLCWCHKLKRLFMKDLVWFLAILHAHQKRWMQNKSSICQLWPAYCQTLLLLHLHFCIQPSTG